MNSKIESSYRKWFIAVLIDDSLICSGECLQLLTWTIVDEIQIMITH